MTQQNRMNMYDVKINLKAPIFRKWFKNRNPNLLNDFAKTFDLNLADLSYKFDDDEVDHQSVLYCDEDTLTYKDSYEYTYQIAEPSIDKAINRVTNQMHQFVKIYQAYATNDEKWEMKLATISNKDSSYTVRLKHLFTDVFQVQENVPNIADISEFDNLNRFEMRKKVSKYAHLVANNVNDIHIITVNDEYNIQSSEEFELTKQSLIADHRLNIGLLKLATVWVSVLDNMPNTDQHPEQPEPEIVAD